MQILDSSLIVLTQTLDVGEVIQIHFSLPVVRVVLNKHLVEISSGH